MRAGITFIDIGKIGWQDHDYCNVLLVIDSQ